MSNKINWYPGHMKKTTDQIEKISKNINIIVNVIDARAIIASNNYELTNRFSNKKAIINVVSKSDLITTKQLLDIKRINIHNVLYFNIKKQAIFKKQFLHLVNNIKDNYINKICLICGIANVGKSTIINTLVGKKKLLSQNSPGTTKKIHVLNIRDNVYAIDSPGITMKKISNEITGYKLILIQSIKYSIVPLTDTLSFAFYYLKKNNINILKNIVNIATNDDIPPSFDEFISLISKKIYCNNNYEKSCLFFLQKIYKSKYIVWD